MKKYKYINHSGEDVFKFSFDKAGWFDHYGYAGVQNGKRLFYINVQGDVVLESNYNLTMFDKDGLGLVHTDDDGIFSYGMLTAKGDWLIPPKYEGLGYRGCGLFCATIKNKDLCLDSSGRQLFTLHPYRLLDDCEFRYDRLLVGRRTNRFFMNTKGDIAHGPYWSAQMYCEGLAFVKLTEKSKPVFVDINGNIAVNFEKYDRISEYWIDGVLKVRDGGKYGLINRFGEFVVDPIYDSIESLFNGYFLAVKQGVRVVINNSGVILMGVPPEMTSLQYAEEDMIAYEKGGKWGYINLKSCSIITPAIYEEAGPMSHGRALVAFVP